MSIAALAEASGRPKSSVHRVLATLINTGFVDQDPVTAKYRLTLKLWRLGVSALNELDLLDIARPHLEALMQATDETVHLSVLDPSGDVMYLWKVESNRSIRVQTQLGGLAPSWCTATGRCLLAFDSRATERALARPLKQRTPRTVTEPARLRAILREVAAKGYAVTKAENHPEMGGIAAPIRDHGGTVVASCGVAVPAFRMNQELIDHCIPVVVKTALDISSGLGYRAAVQRRARHGT